MDLVQEKARKANYAASAISDLMIEKLTDMRPEFADKFGLDDQLVTLAIAQAAVGIAAEAASQATGMDTDEHSDLKEQLHEVVFHAMSNLLEEG